MAKGKVWQIQAFNNDALNKGKEKFKDTSMEDLRRNGELLGLKREGEGKPFRDKNFRC